MELQCVPPSASADAAISPALGTSVHQEARPETMGGKTFTFEDVQGVSDRQEQTRG